VEVRHINRSSSATRQPKADTSTICCVCVPLSTYILWFAVLRRVMGCVIDTLFHTLSRVDRARSAGPPDDARMGRSLGPHRIPCHPWFLLPH
jgi:hypothetical protein